MCCMASESFWMSAGHVVFAVWEYFVGTHRSWVRHLDALWSCLFMDWILSGMTYWQGIYCTVKMSCPFPIRGLLSCFHRKGQRSRHLPPRQSATAPRMFPAYHLLPRPRWLEP